MPMSPTTQNIVNYVIHCICMYVFTCIIDLKLHWFYCSVFCFRFAGYARIVLAIIAFWFMSTNYVIAGWCYIISALLDAVDGHAARAFNQSKFTIHPKSSSSFSTQSTSHYSQHFHSLGLRQLSPSLEPANGIYRLIYNLCLHTCAYVCICIYICMCIWHIYTITNKNVFMRKARTLIIELRVQIYDICYHHSFHIWMYMYHS